MSKEIKVLVVDDLSAQRALFGKALAKQGYQVRGVSDGIAAIDMYEKWPADIIILDVVMDPINGFDVLRKIKNHAQELKKDTRVIMCSIKSGKVDELWAKNQGADDYLVKPVLEDKLVQVVSHWVNVLTKKRKKEESRLSGQAEVESRDSKDGPQKAILDDVNDPQEKMP